MTGPEAYREAVRLLEAISEYAEPDDLQRKYAEDANIIAAAQVHATLALAAATAEPIAQSYDGPDDTTIPSAWSEAIS